MIELHYWPTPNGWKVAIALEEMGLPFAVRLVDIRAGDQHGTAFRKLNPNGKMPVIVDPEGPDGAAIAVFESGAILQYLARKTGRFGGATERERIAVDCWLHWQMGGVGPMAGQTHHFWKYAPAMDPPQDITYAKARYRDETARLYAVLDGVLATRGYVATDAPTIADFAVWPWVSLWEGQRQTLEDKPNLARWLDAMAARPGVAAGRALHADLRHSGGADAEGNAALFGRR